MAFFKRLLIIFFKASTSTKAYVSVSIKLCDTSTSLSIICGPNLWYMLVTIIVIFVFTKVKLKRSISVFLKSKSCSTKSCNRVVFLYIIERLFFTSPFILELFTSFSRGLFIKVKGVRIS